MSENYRVVASTPTRDPYPFYKFYNEPEDWSCNGTVKISSKMVGLMLQYLKRILSRFIV